MRELVYYVAATLDGFIAQRDGTLSAFPWDEEYGADLLALFPETFPAHFHGPDGRATANREFDIVLMGRRTYEVGLREGITNPYPTLEQYLFSRTMKTSPDQNVALVSENAAERVRAIKQGTGKAIWLCGGADLATTLFGAGLIDRLIVKLNPVVFGAGIPLLHGEIEPTALALTDSKSYASGHLLLHYCLNA